MSEFNPAWEDERTALSISISSNLPRKRLVKKIDSKRKLRRSKITGIEPAQKRKREDKSMPDPECTAHMDTNDSNMPQHDLIDTDELMLEMSQNPATPPQNDTPMESRPPPELKLKLYK